MERVVNKQTDNGEVVILSTTNEIDSGFEVYLESDPKTEFKFPESDFGNDSARAFEAAKRFYDRCIQNNGVWDGYDIYRGKTE
jgi:hypothetical protein